MPQSLLRNFLASSSTPYISSQDKKNLLNMSRQINHHCWLLGAHQVFRVSIIDNLYIEDIFPEFIDAFLLKFLTHIWNLVASFPVKQNAVLNWVSSCYIGLHDLIYLSTPDDLLYFSTPETLNFLGHNRHLTQNLKIKILNSFSLSTFLVFT